MRGSRRNAAPIHDSGACLHACCSPRAIQAHARKTPRIHRPRPARRARRPGRNRLQHPGPAPGHGGDLGRPAWPSPTTRRCRRATRPTARACRRRLQWTGVPRRRRIAGAAGRGRRFADAAPAGACDRGRPAGGGRQPARGRARQRRQRRQRRSHRPQFLSAGRLAAARSAAGAWRASLRLPALRARQRARVLGQLRGATKCWTRCARMRSPAACSIGTCERPDGSIKIEETAPGGPAVAG